MAATIEQDLLNDAANFVFATLGQEPHRRFDNCIATAGAIEANRGDIADMLAQALSDEHRGMGTLAQRSAAEKVLQQLPSSERKY